MLRKLNITLGIFAIIGALFVGGVYLYTTKVNIDDNKIVESLGGN